MKKIYCDKCKKEVNEAKKIICVGASIVDCEDRECVRSVLELCEKCRTELKEIIYNWIYEKR